MLSLSLKMPIFSSFIHSITQMKSQLCFCEIWGSKWQSLWILLKVVIKTLKVTKGFFQNFQERKGNQSSSIFQGCDGKPLCFAQVQGMIHKQCLEHTNNDNL